MTARDRLTRPIVQAAFGPAGVGASLAYQIPESVALAEFLSLRSTVTTAAASTPTASLTQTTKQGDRKFRSPQGTPFAAASVNTVSWGPAGAAQSTEGGVQVQETIPGLTIEAGDVFTVALVGGGGGDTIGPATLVYRVIDLSFDAS